MNLVAYFSRSTLYTSLITLLMINLAISNNSYATNHHHIRKTEQHHSTSSKKVLLTSQPNNILTTTASRLNKMDIDFAIRHGEKPLILIGSTNLSATQKLQITLFVQLQSASLCGSSGCTTTAYLKKGNQWIKILDSISGSIEIKKTSHKAMYDLLINTSDVWIWNGSTYIES